MTPFLLFAAGALLLAIGAGLIYVPAGLIVAGLILLYLAVKLTAAATPKQ